MTAATTIRLPRPRAAADKRARPRVVNIRERVQQEALQFVACRALGHEWKHQPPEPVSGRVTFRSTCSVCTTERIKVITRTGEQDTRYIYPRGYSLHGEDRRTTLEWRRVIVITAFEGAK